MFAGPVLLRDSFAEYKKDASLNFTVAEVGKHTHIVRQGEHGFKIHVYQVGEFFFPCNWHNPEYCKEIQTTAEWPMVVAGMHHFKGTWMGKTD